MSVRHCVFNSITVILMGIPIWIAIGKRGGKGVTEKIIYFCWVVNGVGNAVWTSPMPMLALHLYYAIRTCLLLQPFSPRLMGPTPI